MPAARHLYVLFGNFSGKARGDQAEILLQGGAHPLVFVLRQRRLQRHVIAWRGQFIERFSGQFTQQFQTRRVGAFGGDQGRDCLVMGGPCFLHIGDGDQSHFEAFVGLLQLAADGFQCGLRCIDRIFGGQHVKITLRYPQHQALFGVLVVDFCLGDLRIRTLEVRPAVPAENRLSELYLPLTGRVRRRVAREYCIRIDRAGHARGRLQTSQRLGSSGIADAVAAGGTELR